MIFNEVFRALGYVFIAVIVYGAYWFARDYAKGTRNSILLKGFLWCAGIALVASLMMGQPTCESESDPIRGGCDEYAENGYEPTQEQRAANFAYYMTLLYIPVAYGAFSRKKIEQPQS